jgi:hypothetical protein
MTTRSATKSYPRFLGVTAAVIAALCVLGIVPTRRLAGDAGVPGMLAGCGIGFISAALAGLLIVTVPGDSPEAKMKRSFMAMAARIAVVVVLGAAAVTSGMFATSPLLLWIAIAYISLLPLEVRLAL